MGLTFLRAKIIVDLELFLSPEERQRLLTASRLFWFTCWCRAERTSLLVVQEPRRSTKASLNEMKTKVDARADALEIKTADVEAKLDSKVAFNLEAKLDTMLHVLQQLQQDQIEFLQQSRVHRVQVSSLADGEDLHTAVESFGRRFLYLFCVCQTLI